MTRAEDRRAERQAKSDRALLASFPTPRATEPDKVNIWGCPKCGLPTVAVDIHDGTTPMAMVCKANLDHFNDDASPTAEAEDGGLLCGGRAFSTMYVLPPPETTPDMVARLLADPPWEWYTPTDLAELRALANDEPELAAHVRKRGLLLRKRVTRTDVFNPAEWYSPKGYGPGTDQGTRWERFWAGLAGR